MPLKESDRKVLVEEWKEIEQTTRTTQTMIWQVAAILIPIAFALLGFAVDYGLRKFSLALASIMVYSMWLVFYERYRHFLTSQFKRAMEIEHMDGIPIRLHTRVTEDDKQCIRKFWRIHYFAWLFLAVLAMAWVIFILFGV